MPKKTVAANFSMAVLALLLVSSQSAVSADETPEPSRAPITQTIAPKSTATPTLTAAPAPTSTLSPTNPPTATSTEIPSSLPSLTPEAANPIEGIARMTRTQPELAIVGLVSCLGALGALSVVLILFWLSRRQSAPAIPAPYLEHENAGLRIYLKRDTMILGRASDCDLKIASSLPEADTVSPHHARIIKRDARWIVVDGLTDDQPSLNGIYVNGKRTLENYLDEDDELAFGALQFRFHVPPAAHSTLQGDA